MTVTLYKNSGNNPKQRINWLVNAGWKTSTPQYANIHALLNSDASIINEIRNDLNDTSVNRRVIIKSIYINYLRDEVRVLAKQYTVAQFPTNTNDSAFNTLNRTKAELIINYFEGFQDDTIAKYLDRPNFITSLWLGWYIPSINLTLKSTTVAPNFPSTDRAILEGYGIAEWLAEQGAFLDFGIGDLEELEEITKASQSQLQTLKAAARAAKGLPPPKQLSPEDTRSVNQCALLSDLLHKGLSYSAYPQKWGLPPRDTDADCKAFSGRIYPVTIDSFDPNSLVNICTMSSQVKSFFKNTNNTNGLEWYLTWVYMDSSKTLQEEQIFKSNAGNKDMSNLETKLEAKNYFSGLDSDYLQTKQSEITSKKKNYTITSVDITYDGTNPSTARNDVKVKLTISLGSLAALNSTCCYAPMSIDTDGDVSTVERSELVEIKISDLVAGTQANSYESRIIGHAESNQEFIPDTSRIRLKARTRYQPQQNDKVYTTSGVTATDDTDLILDLSVTGHEVSRDSATGKSTLTINYRGYFEQAMNMPYNDALADETLIKNREGRKEKVRQARRDKCSNNLIREIMRTNQEQERIEVESFHKSGGLLKRIYGSGFIYSYSLDQAKLSVGQNGNILDPRQAYVSSIVADPTATFTNYSKKKYEWWAQSANSDESFLADAAGFFGISDDEFREKEATAYVDEINKLYKNKCFFLGDLMELLLDCMYEVNADASGKVISRTAKMRDSAKGMNMRFVMGTIRVPDPKDLGKFITINPLQIPIDVPFFASWYHDTIVKKGITHYPVGTFMKDLIERLINDVIYDTCFALLLPDEQPPQLRMTFFSDCDTRWFKTYTARVTSAGEWFDPLDPYDSNYIRNSSNMPHILMKKDIDFPIAATKNYCVIYQQNPSYFRQLKYQQTKKLKDDPYCPSIYYGYNMTSLNFLSNPKFTRSDTTYLKEARFFSNQLGNLSLLSNIYDVSFDIKTRKINTFFYPGNIITFILTDFDGGGKESLSNWGTIETDIDESDPHKKGTLANTLGMGGYHVIKSVSYKIDNKENLNTTISIATKFMGTDAIGDKDPVSDTTPFADEQKRCITQYNTAVTELRKTEGKTGIVSTGIERIYDAGVTDSTESATTSPEATRVVVATTTTQTIISQPPVPGGPPPPPPPANTPTDKDILKTTFTLTQAQSFTVGDKYNGDSINSKQFTEDHILEVVSITTTNVKGDTVKWKITPPNGGSQTTVEVTYE